MIGSNNPFNLSHFTQAALWGGSFLSGAVYTGVKAATVTSLVAKVSLAASAVFLAGAALGVGYAYLDSETTDEFYEKLPKAAVATGGVLTQTIATTGLTHMFNAIFDALGKAIGDSIYEKVTGKDRNAHHVHTYHHTEDSK